MNKINISLELFLIFYNIYTIKFVTFPFGYLGYYTITGNVIMGPINNSVDDTLYLEHNIIDMTNSISISNAAISGCRAVYAYNNTIISREYGIYADYVFATNNIISAGHGIRSQDYNEDIIDYNLFWDFTNPVYGGCALGVGNIVNEDPLLKGGNPFDYFQSS